MDFFKFISEGDPTTLDHGQEINGIKSSLWVERYADLGEFSFTAQLSSGLKVFLPEGTLISHADTFEIMIVENHNILEPEDEDPTLVVTGRSFVSYLENRIVGSNLIRADSRITSYPIAADFTWNQIVSLINDHIGGFWTPDDGIADVLAMTALTGTGISVDRVINYGPVWERVAELLKVDNLGIRTIRKNTFDVGSSTDTLLNVHKGIDRSDSVIFSSMGGEIASAEYLFSNKNNKNSAMVLGQYVGVVVDTGPTHYDRRMMLVDATDIDGYLNSAPTGSALAPILAAMTTRGQQALMAQNHIAISQTDVSKTSKYQYRRDYDIGDLISLHGNFGEIAIMRVIEYAEIEDENGESGHPTLALPGG